MKLIFCCFCILSGYTSLYAQRGCATQLYADARGTNLQQNEKMIFSSRDTISDEVIIIPVVVHVLYKNPTENISDAQVISQLIALNKDFRKLNSDTTNIPSAFKPMAADSRIQFCLARVDPQGRPASGIIRKATSTSAFLANDEMKFSSQGGDDAWDSKRYLNIWVCNLLGRNLGYATFPGGAADRDGIVIQFDVFGTAGTVRAPYNKGRTATHETGHWLGLKHIWGDADCGNDDVTDTPPQKAYSTGCPSFPRTSTCSVNADGDMFMNFMDFTDDACMYMFTAGQKRKMRGVFAQSGARNSLLNSSVCDSSKAESGPLPVQPATAEGLRIFPNPAISTVTIELKNLTAAGKRLLAYNVNGRLVLDMLLKQQQTVLNLANWPAGVYLVKVGDGKDSMSAKFIRL